MSTHIMTYSPPPGGGNAPPLRFTNSQKRHTKKKGNNKRQRFNMTRETREEMEMEAHGGAGEEADTLSPSTLKLYETQFFGFTPETCMLRIYSAFRDSLCDILPVVEKVCVRQLSKGESNGAEELLRSQARECSRKLQQYLERRFKQLAERREVLLVNRCFTVPPSVLLPEDKSHSKHTQDIQVGQKEVN